LFVFLLALINCENTLIQVVKLKKEKEKRKRKKFMFSLRAEHGSPASQAGA